MSAAFDTLRLARTLRDKAQFSTEQAEGMADAIAEVMQGDLATKRDLVDVRSDVQKGETALRTEIREVELRLSGRIDTLRSDLKAEIASAKNDTIRWIVGPVGFQTIAILGAALALARAFAK